MKLLLLSSSKVENTEYLTHAKTLIQSHLSATIKRALFVPYAGVSVDYNTYETMVANAFEKFGYQVDSIHHANDPVEAIKSASAILVGGGNTFNLLNELYKNDQLTAIKTAVASGVPYIGWSAGSNIAAPSIKTTNDMPIVQPPSFDALDLIPFQVNPHYIDGNPPGHQGETREQRINEFLKLNPDVKVIGIPEGTALRSIEGELSFVGSKNGFMFSAKDGKTEIKPEQVIV